MALFSQTVAIVCPKCQGVQFTLNPVYVANQDKMTNKITTISLDQSLLTCAGCGEVVEKIPTKLK